MGGKPEHELSFTRKVEMITKVLGPLNKCEGTKAALWRYAAKMRVFKDGQTPDEVAERDDAARKVDWRYQLQQATVPGRTRSDLDGAQDSEARNAAKKWLAFKANHPRYRNLLLHGVSGAGKSVAASELLMPLKGERESWKRARYFSEREFAPLMRLREPDVRDVWRLLENVRLLVIDNLGETTWGGARFFAAVAGLIGLRSDRNLRTVLVSRLGEKEITEIFGDKLARLLFQDGDHHWLGEPYVGL